MKKSLTLALALLTASFVFGDDLTEQPLTLEQKEEKHFARAGVDYDIFWAPVSIDSYYPYYNESGQRIGHYHGHAKQTSQYQGVRFIWEWLEPNFLYAGLNLWFARGNIHSQVYFDRKKNEDVHSYSNLWINKDIALGYNYRPSSNSGFLLSVFVGNGSHYERKYEKRAQWKYGMAGFKMTQDLPYSLTMGVDFKTMYAYHLWDPHNVTSFERKDDRNFWGIELATPVTWHFGGKRRFDLKVKPYLLKLNINSNVTILGTTMGFGYTY